MRTQCGLKSNFSKNSKNLFQPKLESVYPIKTSITPK